MSCQCFNVLGSLLFPKHSILTAATAKPKGPATATLQNRAWLILQNTYSQKHQFPKATESDEKNRCKNVVSAKESRFSRDTLTTQSGSLFAAFGMMLGYIRIPKSIAT